MTKDRRDMSDRELLVRLDERMEITQDDIKSIDDRIRAGAKDIYALQADVQMLKDRWNWIKWAGGICGATGLTGIATWIKSLV